jgi:hypothetical protein
MKNLRVILLAVCCFLLAACCLIGYLATRESYQKFAEGRPAQGTVVSVRSGDERPLVKVRLRGIAGAPVVHVANTTSRDLALSVGQVVQLRSHRSSAQHVMLESDLASIAPSIWLLIGLGGCLALGGYILSLPGQARRRRMARTSSLDVIVESLRRTRNLQLGMGTFLTACGIGAVFLILEENTATKVMMGALIALFVGVGALMLRRGLGLLVPERSWIMKVILEEPARIAWIYQQVFTSEGVAATANYNVAINLTDGRLHSLSVNADDADGLIAELSRRAPGAVVGYEESLEKRFKQSPATFAQELASRAA